MQHIHIYRYIPNRFLLIFLSLSLSLLSMHIYAHGIKFVVFFWFGNFSLVIQVSIYMANRIVVDPENLSRLRQNFCKLIIHICIFLYFLRKYMNHQELQQVSETVDKVHKEVLFN